MAIVSEAVHKPNHILVSTGLEYLHLSLDQLLQFRSLLHKFVGNDFDCHSTTIVFLVNGLVDISPCPLPDNTYKGIGLDVLAY